MQSPFEGRRIDQHREGHFILGGQVIIMDMGIGSVQTTLDLGMEFLVLNEHKAIEYTNMQRQAAYNESKKCLLYHRLAG